MASLEKLSVTEINSIKSGILEQINAIRNRPFKVSIIGQTGVGKSSLLNALFNVNLKTDAVKPCTKEVEEILIKNKQGHTMLFYDLPGIGESVEADEKYLQDYRTHLLESDVVLWAIYADNRSVTFDLEALNQIMKGFEKTQQAQLVSKLTFVLTKADVLYSPPWFLLKMDNQFAKFIPSEDVMKILDYKASYYQEQFLKPYGNLIVSRTYNDCRFNIQETQLPITFDEFFVYYTGFLDATTLSHLKTSYPIYIDVFDRLYSNYQVVPCSALFRFNLNGLMLAIVNKLGQEAVLRFKNFFEQSQLDKYALSESKKFCNLIVYDPNKKKKVFDFSEILF